MGPLLFIIYANDLPEFCGESCSMFLYADDAKVFGEISTRNDCTVLNQYLNCIITWCDEWQMRINPSKCNVFSLVCNRNKEINHNYEALLGGDTHKLAHVDTVNDLGVLMDDSLKFDKYIYAKIGSAYKMLGVLKRNFVFYDKTTFLTLYKAFVRSVLEYGVPVWSPYKLVVVHDIERA